MKSSIKVNGHEKEMEIPDGGGKGRESLYIVEVIVDGEVCLHLTTGQFKKPGQAAKFLEEMKRLTQ